MIPKILLIKDVPAPMAGKMGKVFGDDAEIVTAESGLSGIFAFQREKPWLTVIDENLPDVSGLSVSTILKDTEVENSIIYLLVRTHVLENTKADRLYDAKTSPSILMEQMKRDLSFLHEKIEGGGTNDGLEYASYQQMKMLPSFIYEKEFSIEYVFSAFDKRSGDSVNFWYDKKKDPSHLYGYLFDCEGHNVSSFGQVGSAWMLLRKSMEEYQGGDLSSLADVMGEVNQDYIHLTPIKSLVPSIAFCFDFKEKVMRFCTAGMPYVFFRRKGETVYSPQTYSSSIIGYEKESSFEEQTVNLEDVEDIIFTSDGLSDLFSDHQGGEVLESAKHDDVSAIHVHISHPSRHSDSARILEA